MTRSLKSKGRSESCSGSFVASSGCSWLALLAVTLISPLAAAPPSKRAPQPSQHQDPGKERSDSRSPQPAERSSPAAQAPALPPARTPKALDVLIPEVKLQNVPAKQAIEWWAKVTGIQLVVNWQQLEQQLVPIDQPVTVELKKVSADLTLRAILKQMQGDATLLYEIHPQFLRILTREQAEAEAVTRIYDIADLLHEPEDFKGPSFDLQSALSNSSGGSGGGGGGSPFSGSTNEETAKATRQERAGQIIDLITTTVEPRTWQASGGNSTIRYLNGRIIVRAPLYVHQQIGLPAVSLRR